MKSKKQQGYIHEILNLTKKQEKELDETVEQIRNPPDVVSKLLLDSSEIQMEVAVILLSEEIKKYIILRITYPKGNLSIDEFKELSEIEYYLYKAESKN